MKLNRYEYFRPWMLTLRVAGWSLVWPLPKHSVKPRDESPVESYGVGMVQKEVIIGNTVSPQS